MILAPPSWPLVMLNTTTTTSSHDDEHDNPSRVFQTMLVTPEAFLFNHHPTLANVEASEVLWTMTTPTTTKTASTMITIKATRHIVEGQELFFNFHQHLHSILPHWYQSILPTMDDYQEATIVLHQARQAIKDPPGPRGRKLAKSASVVGPALQVVQQVMARYRPVAAKLLKQAFLNIPHYEGRVDQANILHLGLKNRTWSSLSIHGFCLSNIVDGGVPLSGDVVTAAGLNDPTSRLRTVHAVPKGHRFHPVPILLRRHAEENARPPDMSEPNDNGHCQRSNPSESCPNSAMTVSSAGSDPSTCWSWGNNNNSMLDICPLQQAFLMNRVGMASIMPLDNTEAASQQAPNVQLQWSQWKQATSVFADASWESLADMVRSILPTSMRIFSFTIDDQGYDTGLD
jgi:hypothetical protein